MTSRGRCMTTGKLVDIQEFARRVETFCDFILGKIESHDGSADLKVIEDLKNDAANIHMLKLAPVPIEGLDEFMRGHSQKKHGV